MISVFILPPAPSKGGGAKTGSVIFYLLNFLSIQALSLSERAWVRTIL
jgi:hypothetical protein